MPQDTRSLRKGTAPWNSTCKTLKNRKTRESTHRSRRLKNPDLYPGPLVTWKYGVMLP